MISSQQFAETLLWLIFAFNSVGFIFQIHTNHIHRSTQAISFWLILTYHIANTSFLMFVYFLWLPLPMRVMVPFDSLIVALLVAQEIWFAPTTAFRRKVTLWHGGVLIATSFLWYAGLFKPLAVGHLAGWIAVCVLSVAQFPQIYRNWERKSVYGVSVFYLTCSTIASLLQLWINYILNLPLPSYANSVRSLLKRFILCGQFVFYRRRSKK